MAKFYWHRPTLSDKFLENKESTQIIVTKCLLKQTFLQLITQRLLHFLFQRHATVRLNTSVCTQVIITYDTSTNTTGQVTSNPRYNHPQTMQSHDYATAIIQERRMLYKPKRVRLQRAIAIYTMRLTKQFTIGERAAVCLKDRALTQV